MLGSGDAVDEEMLADAIVKARKLVAEMQKQQREIEQAPPPGTDLTPQQLADGKVAFENAIGSARRMLKALEDAREIARHAQQADETDRHDPN
jgi:hypothetical protein